MLVRDDLPDGCALVDLGEHRLRDLARPVRIFQLTGPGLRAEFPPLRTLEAFAGNLPVQLSSFVGRAGELAGLAVAVRAWPLVTVTGPGGAGNPAGGAGRGGPGAVLQGRCVAVRAGRGGRRGDDGAGRRGRAAGTPPARPVHRGQRGGVLADQERAAAGAGQLRAPAEPSCCPGGGHLARLPGSADPGHEPAGAQRGRGAGLRAAATVTAAGERGPGDRRRQRRGIHVRAAGRRRTRRLRARPGERGRGLRDLQAAGRDPAGHRAGRRPGGGAAPGRDRRPAR
jgi:hypothetical protein